MKLRLLFALFLLPFALLFAAEKKSAAAPADAALLGDFAGTWRASEGGAGGNFEISLKQDEAKAWAAEATFTFEGARVPGRVKSTRVEDGKLTLVFDWTIQDAAGQSRVTGRLVGEILSGDYESTTAEGTTRGIWTLKRVPAVKKG
jgi:hypothetical protein